jgi:hypothetical protein
MTKDHQIGDGPIDPELVEAMNDLARFLDNFFNGPKRGDDRDTGFILMVFPFRSHEGRCNYISNADRDDVKILIKEQLARFEGQANIKGRA